MTAAAAARRWWAARTKGASAPTAVAAAAVVKPAITVTAVLLAALVAGAFILAAALGWAATVWGAGQVRAERHLAVRQALEQATESPSGAGQFDDAALRRMFDDAALRRMAERAGIDGLRFDAEPARQRGRAVQSVHDARGRIVGWLSWSDDDALVRSLDWLWGALAAVGAVLGFGALLARRAVPQLARRREPAAKVERAPIGRHTLAALPDHKLMMERLAEALAGRTGTVAFALIDLDGFREVNDALGRTGGDAVLLNVADNLRAGLPAGSLLGRSEEHDFCVIAGGEDGNVAAALSEQLRAGLQRPIFVDRIWQITAGIGVAQAPEHGTSSEDVVRRAGLALRAAKREGRSQTRMFTPQIERSHAERRFLFRELQSAVSRQAFDVHYQPVVAATGGGIVGVEALLRWTHPSRGDIPPSTFIPLAEQSGLMSQLGAFVLRRALSDAVRWPTLSISVNLSPLQIRDRWLVDLVGRVMADTGIASSRVVLEVTEGILIDNPQEAQQRLEALRALGVRVALDDFGSGYSSLSYLQKFPFDQLKIDRAFVASLGSSANAGAIIQSIVTLGHALGMKVLAEGVESDAQRVLLRLAGCDEMQGFLFARPAPAAAIDKLLARQARAAAG